MTSHGRLFRKLTEILRKELTGMIVKVQRSVFPPGGKLVLIYNRSNSFMWQGELDRKTSKRIGRSLKQFWYAHIKDSQLVLEEKAPWQEW